MPMTTPVQRWIWKSARRRKVGFGIFQKPIGRPILQLGPEIRTYPEQIRENTAGRHGGAGARALYDERVLVVAARDEPDDVVGQVDVRERVRAIELHDSDRRLAGRRVERGHVAK